MITAIHHVQITVPPEAVDEARDFYCHFLGLAEIEKPDSLKSRGGFWLQIGAQAIHVGIEDGVPRHLSKAHVAYQVDDLNRWREVLTAADIAWSTGILIPGFDRLEFRDPFGNRIELIHAVGLE